MLRELYEQVKLVVQASLVGAVVIVLYAVILWASRDWVQARRDKDNADDAYIRLAIEQGRKDLHPLLLER